MESRTVVEQWCIPLEDVVQLGERYPNFFTCFGATLRRKRGIQVNTA
jgi:hypothetical protein